MSAIGMIAIVSILNAVVLISLVLLATWCYCRYTGELREVGSKIDDFAHIIWDVVSYISTDLSQDVNNMSQNT